MEKDFFCWDECVQRACDTGDAVIRCEIECEKCRNNDFPVNKKLKPLNKR